jgi:hypothetical protein
LGIATALGVLGLQVATATAFWQAIAMSAVAGIMLGTAAWGTFVAGGRYGIQPRAGRIATGLSIGIGMLCVGGLAFLVFLAPMQQRVAPVFRSSNYSGYTVTGDGLFVKITRESSRIVEVTDPEGNPVQYNPRERNGAGVLNARLRSGPWPRRPIQSLGWLFTQLREPGNGDFASWYYDHGAGLIAAYDSQSRKLLGWLGPDGFSAGESLPPSFTGRLRKQTPSGEQHLLMLEDVVYRVDLDERRVERIFQSDPGEVLLDVAAPQSITYTPTGSQETSAFEAFWTTKRVILQLRNGTRLLEAPQDSGTLGYAGLVVYRAESAPGLPTFLWYEGDQARLDHVAEFDSAGTVVNSWTLAPAYRVVEEPWLSRVTSSALVPPIGQVALALIVRSQPPGTTLPLSGPARIVNWSVAILSALLCATAVLLRGRSHAFPPGRLFAWTAITLLFGLLGYLTMLALIEWPARESCPACSRKRVVVRERCEHCGAPFADPPRDGTEIFESATAKPAA